MEVGDTAITTGEFSSTAASVTANKLSRLLMLKAPTAYASRVAGNNRSLFVTNVTFHHTSHGQIVIYDFCGTKLVMWPVVKQQNSDLTDEILRIS